MGYGFFNAGIMTVASKGLASAKRNRIRGKGSQARRADGWLSIVAKTGDAVYPLVQVPPHADHLKAYTTGLATA